MRICVSVDDSDELLAVHSWFERWEAALTYRSEDEGGGCCVHIWDVDGPDQAIAELPESVRCEHG